MTHPDALRLQAYFDGELDAVAAAEIEQHIEQCAECRAEIGDLQGTRNTLRRELTYFRAPTGLRARVAQVLDQESSRDISQPSKRARSAWRARPFWIGVAGGGFAVAGAAALAFLLWVQPPDSLVADELVNAHVRSLMSAHPVDVLSTDKHTVKPWFAGHADVSPVVADFEAQGYKLVGGRADYLDHQRAAVVVYQHGAHVINVFAWAADRRSLRVSETLNGYHLIFWKTQDLEYCAISDTGPDELLGLVRLLQDASPRDPRE